MVSHAVVDTKHFCRITLRNIFDKNNNLIRNNVDRGVDVY